MIEQFVAVVVALIGGFYAARSDFGRYSIGTVGSFKRIDRRPATDTGEECSDCLCETAVADGEERVYYKEIVIFGAVILRYGGGSNVYCADHTSLEFEQLDDDAFVTTTERVGETIVAALFGFTQFVATSEDEHDDNPFNDVQASVNSTFELAGAACLVLIAAGIIVTIRGLGVPHLDD